MEKILNTYYENNAKKLKNVVDKIFNSKYGGIAGKDMDEFYSVANDVFADIIRHKRYDPSKGDFDGFLYGALCLAFIDEYKRQNRNKRTSKIEVEERNEKGEVIRKKIPVRDVYMDTPIGEDGDTTIGDTLRDTRTVESEFFGENEEAFSPEMMKYLSRLSPLQREVLRLISVGYTPNEILGELHINQKMYEDCYQAIHSYRNISILM